MARAEAALARLGEIEHVQHLEVRRNLNQDSQSPAVDLVVYGEFADEAALAAYKRDPRYSEVTAVVRPLRDMRLAADIRA